MINKNMSSSALYPNIKYEDLITLFNNISKFIYYTTDLVSGNISNDAWGLRMRHMLRPTRHLKTILSFDHFLKEFKITLKDDSILANVLTNENERIFILVVSDDLNKNISVIENIKFFSDSIVDTVFVIDYSLFNSNDNEVYKIAETLFKLILSHFLKDNFDNTNVSITNAITKLLCHFIYEYQDNFISDARKEILDRVLGKIHTSPITLTKEQIKESDILEFITS